MTAGVISPVVSSGGLEGASCSTVAKRDWEGIFGLRGMYDVSEEVELDTETFAEEATGTLGGGGEFGAECCDGTGDRGDDGGGGMCADFPLLRVGSEEAMEGFRRDSLGRFKATVCSYMHPNNGRTVGAMSARLRRGCIESS
jgi:hypothetical protein